ncbi:DUF6638 family protein [Fretibacter rubidus]|uniref:DUF6638 family protein n=1 Tax=Fretibacter rubidus TaxID=570162 RepID=UPI00352AF17C
MMRLVKNGLMFGNLLPVTAPALIARYNRALNHLIGRETALTEFHIDIAGYSPEIGLEFEDDLYLNPQGCNRLFILLTTDQKTAPLLNSRFSTSRDILRHYIEENEEQLFALTAREAVAGELMNSVFDIKTPADLLNINQVDIEADTIQDHVAEASVLQTHIDRFLNEDDAWWDDVLIADMIELAKRTGDIQRNPVGLKTQSYAQGNYYTDHMGGVYVFRDTKTPTIIARRDIEGLRDLPIENILTFDDRTAIADFLRDEGLSELIVQYVNDSSAAIIRQKLDFVVISTAAALGHDLKGVSRTNVRMLERRYAANMPPEYTGLMEVYRWASKGGKVPGFHAEHPAFFYALRSSRHDNMDLVNMLLTDLSRLDFRQLFICHKPLFYETFRGWSEQMKDYACQFLMDEYAVDKAAARDAIFGAEPAMEPMIVDDIKPKRPIDTKEGPWGGVLVRDGKYVVKGRGKTLRDELDWDKDDYKSKKSGKKKRRKK